MRGPREADPKASHAVTSFGELLEVSPNFSFWLGADLFKPSRTRTALPLIPDIDNPMSASTRDLSAMPPKREVFDGVAKSCLGTRRRYSASYRQARLAEVGEQVIEVKCILVRMLLQYDRRQAE